MQEPHWVSKATALAMHNRQLAEHGGGEGVRDEGLLESALAKAQNVFFYADAAAGMPRLAASYAYGIATNHPFIDGNKRTALVVSQTFLALNGYIFTGSYEDEYAVFIKIASGKWSEDQLAEWFERNTKVV